MEVLVVGSRSNEVLHNVMALIAKLLTICTEVRGEYDWTCVDIMYVDNSMIPGV